MSEWSSYKDQQDLFESWREYVEGEAELEEAGQYVTRSDADRVQKLANAAVKLRIDHNKTPAAIKDFLQRHGMEPFQISNIMKSVKLALEESSLNEAPYGTRTKRSTVFDPGSAQGVFDRLKTAKSVGTGQQTPTPVPEPPECPDGQVPDPEDPTKCIEAPTPVPPECPDGQVPDPEDPTKCIDKPKPERPSPGAYTIVLTDSDSKVKTQNPNNGPKPFNAISIEEAPKPADGWRAGSTQSQFARMIADTIEGGEAESLEWMRGVEKAGRHKIIDRRTAAVPEPPVPTPPEPEPEPEERPQYQFIKSAAMRSIMKKIKNYLNPKKNNRDAMDRLNDMGGEPYRIPIDTNQLLKVLNNQLSPTTRPLGAETDIGGGLGGYTRGQHRTQADRQSREREADASLAEAAPSTTVIDKTDLVKDMHYNMTYTTDVDPGDERLRGGRLVRKAGKKLHYEDAYIIADLLAKRLAALDGAQISIGDTKTSAAPVSRDEPEALQETIRWQQLAGITKRVL